ncbi:hypothetical protein [Falsiroseomonas selenitidurans]|uniref:Uncharacterized protein n=1 Tax=Falsiroseomonas selenitidurans TaxID=2716335 RepID=A0ABX1E9J7_9PROT|nr:hypothetical protein [Falsiroseomonas selenitidurans]NKC32182.1 hypothetical protein [Falsiroseomonas selenitidurans]
MSAFFVAALLLSVAAYLHTSSTRPEMRPAHPLIDLLWRVLSFAALLAWAGLLLRGFYERHWSDAVAALLGSFAVNWWFGHRGPKPAWPAVSMLFAVSGLGLATYSFLYE